MEGESKICLHVLPAVKLNLRSMIKVSHCRKWFCQLGHRVKWRCCVFLWWTEARLLWGDGCGQSRVLQPTTVVKVPNVTFITSQLRNCLQDKSPREQFAELLQYYFNITVSVTVTCCALLIYSFGKKKIIIYCLRTWLISADKADLCNSEKPSLIQKKLENPGWVNS